MEIEQDNDHAECGHEMSEEDHQIEYVREY